MGGGKWVSLYSDPSAKPFSISVYPLGWQLMRQSYLITYDIRDDKRLRKVHRTMKNFGDHLQYSVFECQLNDSELLECQAALAEVINHREDQVLFVDLGPSEGRGDRVITAMGQAYAPMDAACQVV